MTACRLLWFTSIALTARIPGQTPDGASYVGSPVCKTCHQATWARWSRTRMANVLTDPKLRPEVILPDFKKPDPLRNFGIEDIAFVYGGKFKQRYFRKSGDDYFPLPATWDVTNQVWRPYSHIQQPTGQECDGCHSVNYDIRTKTVTEWNVGCEKCHGPGSEHARRPSRANIVNPARLDYVKANDVCIQCHSTGESARNPIEGRNYAWPVGFHPGMNLREFWTLDDRHARATDSSYYPDGTGSGNRMQGNDFVTSLMYTHGVTCFSCHDVHGTENNADLLKPPSVLCLQCHGPASPNGPRPTDIARHTHHAPGSAGSECIGCHMPKIQTTIADVKVHAHTFRFIPPAVAQPASMPDSCTACHTDKTARWAADALRTWPEFSPWRMIP
jgi:predicted CXXCH cytochrome family protein